ncbi:hypothetical protein IWW50_004327 [Coemansia erecta]|nr:hypothetical protein IWW50_004327 [Coemansia erecta]
MRLGCVLSAALASVILTEAGKVVFKRPVSRQGFEHLGRVIGGTDAAGNAYPFAAFLMINEGDATAFCGGTIIADQWILTAGHCVVDTSIDHVQHAPLNGTEPAIVLHTKLHTKHPMRALSEYSTVGADSVTVGLGSVSTNELTALGVSDVFVHPDINLDYFDNDVALLKLANKLTFNSNVQPIRLDTSEVTDGTTVTGIGWGVTSLETRNTADVLQQVDLKIGDEGLCHRIRPEFTGNNGNYICVTTPDGRDTCSGDSGGPLLRRCSSSPNQGGAAGVGEWIQLGITSYGDSVSMSPDAVCATKDGAGFYTHAATYIGFISETTGISREKLTGTCSGSRVDFVAGSAPLSAAPLALMAAASLFSLIAF